MRCRASLGWILAAALLVGTAPAIRGAGEQAFAAVQGEEIERFLADASMRLGKTLGGVTMARQAILERGGVSHFAVFKTIDEKRAGLTQLARGAGAELEFQDSWRTEIPAYELDKLLNLGMVPVTVERVFQGIRGSLQAWVELKMSEADRLKNKISAPNVEEWNQQIHKVRMFDNLIYNVDRHMNNIQVTSDWKVVLIDHSRAFRRFPQLRAERDMTRFSRSLLAAMEKLDRTTLTARTSKYLDRYQIDGILERRDLIVARARRLAAENGEAAVYFP
jgi:hypothetical protein